MAVNVVVEIGGKIGGHIIGHAVEVLERFQQRRRLLIHRLNAHDCAGGPRGIFGELDDALLNDRGDAHGAEYISLPGSLPTRFPARSRAGGWPGVGLAHGTLRRNFCTHAAQPPV